MEAYRIYYEINYAETSRDEDEICTTELKVIVGENAREKTREFCQNYMEEHFLNMDNEFRSELHETENGFSAIDFRSWGKHLKAERLEVDES